MVAVQQIAFDRPGGQSSQHSIVRPVDLVHLARQTSGDRALEGDILCLFRQQLSVALSRMKTCRGRERMLIAHTLKGSARLIGAFALSRVCEQVEECPNDDSLLEVVEDEGARVMDFIHSICR